MRAFPLPSNAPMTPRQPRPRSPWDRLSRALGYGWSDNFSMNLSLNNTTNVATITEENGAQVLVNPSPAGSPPSAWCPSNANDNYCADAPG